MDRASKFIELHNKIAAYLRQLVGAERTTPFSELVDQAALVNPAVRRCRELLKDYGDLRNAIVHHRNYPKEIIAEPTEVTLARFAEVVRNVLSPERLIPTFQKDVQCFSPSDQLVSVLRYMRQSDFSQVTIRKDGELSLLTTEGIARWFEGQAEEDIISVTAAIVEEALAHDIPDSLVVMSRDHTIYEARETFANALKNRRPRLFAILITETGKRIEQPLGIVTPWDLLEDADA